MEICPAPAMNNVSLGSSAIICTFASGVPIAIVSKLFDAPPDAPTYSTVNTLFVIDVVIPVPPIMLKLSVVVCAVLEPESAVTDRNNF